MAFETHEGILTDSQFNMEILLLEIKNMCGLSVTVEMLGGMAYSGGKIHTTFPRRFT